jgi:hypothetical protein
LKLLSLGYLKEAQDAEFVMGDIIFNDGEGKRKSSATSMVETEVARVKFDEYVTSILSKGKCNY